MVSYFEWSTAGKWESEHFIHTFCPAELALVEFNLEDGMVDETEICWRIAHGLSTFPSDEAYYQALERCEFEVESFFLSLRPPSQPTRH